MERIFAHFKSDKSVAVSSYDPGDPETYDQYLQAMMEDAWDYETSILAGDRSQAQLLFYGLSPSLDYTDVNGAYRGEDPNATFGDIVNKEEKNNPNRSTYVSTDVRDAVMLMMPSLIRLFGATESPAYLVPRSQAGVLKAEEGTDYINYLFWSENSGFLILHAVFKDALTVRAGYVKWWTEDNKEIKRKRFGNITQEQLQFIQSEDDTARVVELGPEVKNQTPPPAAGGNLPAVRPPKTYQFAVIEYEDAKPLTKVSAVPPEEMRLDRYARTFRESRIVGHERIVPFDQAIEMGVPRDVALDNIQSSESNTFSLEPQLRNPGRFMGSSVGDGVMVGDWYVRIDKDGDGVPELRRIRTVGMDSRTVVEDEYANRIKMAQFGCDPIGHTIVGDSLADYTEDVQRIKTNMMRAILDSAAESLNPKTVVNELMVDVDDALNDDLGAIIRTRGDVNATVAIHTTPFLGQQAMPVVDMINDQLARRTGLTDAAKGLDPKALQSSTEIGVEAVINGAQERVELVARILCETGFKDLFTGLFNEICENPAPKRMLQLRGKWSEIDPSTFDESMTVEVNANLGKGSDLTRMIALQGIKQDQQLLVTQMGLNNPICGIQEMLNTQTDILSLANVKNVGRYFKTPTPEQMQALQSAPAKPDPMAVAAQAQLEKVRSDSAKALAEQQFNNQKLQTDTDLKRDQMHHKTAIDMEKIRVDAEKAGVDTHVQLAQLSSQLQKDQSDREASDQDTQIKMAQADNERQAGELAARQHEHDAQIKAATLLAQHKQAGDATQAQHSQSMTQMAAQHHQAMTGHEVKAATAVVGALAGDADRAAGAQDSAANRAHQSQESQRDREHQATTTAATLNTQKNIAKTKATKPKPKARK